MLSYIACYSCYLAVPVVALSWVVSREDGFVLRKHERSRPRLWIIAVIILICGIDFAVLPRAMHPFFRPRLYAFDAGVLLIPLLVASLFKWSIGDLWILGGIVGLLGMLSLPSIGVR
jgi:hypothetical protein